MQCNFNSSSFNYKSDYNLYTFCSQREEAKQQRIQQVAEQHALAEEHHRHALMRNYGLKPWKRLLQTTRRNMDVAVDHHSTVLLGRCLLPWHRYTQDVKRGKVQVAEDQYHDMIARRCFNSWKKVCMVIGK